MIRKILHHYVGLLIVTVVIAGVLSMLLRVVPYVLLAVLITTPVYGVARKRMNWTYGMASICKRIRFRNLSVDSCLVGGIVVWLLHKQINAVMIETLLVCLGGMLGMCLAWEGIRWSLKSGG